MEYNVAQLLKELTGAVRRYELMEDLSELDPELEFLGPLVGTLQLLRTNSGILATGELSTAVRVICNRCIEPIAVPALLPTTTARRRVSADTDSALIIDEHHILNMTEVIRQNIWTAMPMFAGCNWAGSGECPNLTAHLKSLQGVRLIIEDEVKAVTEGQQADAVDPRWAALLELEKKQRTQATENKADDLSSAI